MQRLRAYVRRTMLAAAKEYAYPAKRRTAESTRSAFMDYTRGTDTGTWSDLIYTVDALDLFNRYRSDVATVIRQFCDDAGLAIGAPLDARESFGRTYADLITATARRQTWEQYRGEGPRAEEADAATYAIRFAVECLAHDVAREICPDL